MRYLLLILLALFMLLQYRLWISDEGMQEMWRLRELVDEQAARNIELELRNAALEAEVRDLRQGSEAVEERARSDLGMIHDRETFFQIVGDEYQDSEPATDNADAADQKP